MTTVIEGPRSEPSPHRPNPPSHVRSAGSPLGAYLERVHARHRMVTDGSVATYIPELGRADPSWFGIAAATVDGVVHAVGDADVPFTIQSISKPLTYALVLDDLGEAEVRARIGVEPTGDAFNAITLDRLTGRPLNPMVNAGAIAAAGLVRARPGTTAEERVLDGFSGFAGRALEIDRSVEASERATGHRNRAIGHLLRASGVLDGDADTIVERYFAQCSVEVTAADLAIIAATLANGGVNPVTGTRAASPATVRAVLAVMSTCGMYDGAGEWLFTIGLPAKSGVSGGIMAVVPGRLGLGFFAPPLDAQGNSVRGGLACRDIVRELELHPLGGVRAEAEAIRCTYSVAQVSSKRTRSAAERDALRTAGEQSLAIELQGSVTFLAVESIAAIIRARAPLETLIVDLRRVEQVEPAAVPLLGSALVGAAEAGGRIVLSGTARHVGAVEALRAHGASLETADELDTALELAEDVVLASVGHVADETVAAVAHPILSGLPDADRQAVVAGAVVRSFAAGARLVRAGDPSDAVFLVLAGRLSVSLPVDGHRSQRLATLGPGMVFGETALLGGGRRSADVTADGPVTCLVLSAAAFDRLAATRPSAAIAILRNLLGTATGTTARLTGELAVLAG